MPEQYQSRAAIRLIFEYDEDGVRLVSERPVEMAIADDQAARARPFAGYYLDTRDVGDATLTRTPIEGAFAGSMEVFPEDPQAPVIRIDAPKQRGAFTVVVPASEATDHVALISVAETVGAADIGAPPAATAVAPRIVELARFRLRR